MSLLAPSSSHIRGSHREHEPLPSLPPSPSPSPTEEEDLAYCMLGILGVSLTVNYGEGREKALQRLQEEVKAQRCHLPKGKTMLMMMMVVVGSTAPLASLIDFELTRS